MKMYFLILFFIISGLNAQIREKDSAGIKIICPRYLETEICLKNHKFSLTINGKPVNPVDSLKLEKAKEIHIFSSRSDKKASKNEQITILIIYVDDSEKHFNATSELHASDGRSEYYIKK